MSILIGQGETMEQLIRKIAALEARLGVVGIGYVGLPLAVEFAKAGFFVVGIDIDSERVAMLNAGHSYISDVNEVELASLVAGGRLRAVQDYRVVSELDVVSICVPAPLSLGVAYKRDVTDWRESPTLEIIRLLRLKGALVEYHDPLVATIKVDGVVECSWQLSAEALRGPRLYGDSYRPRCF
ncbi:MAG: UDP binding domain-containing protein [Thermodesulfobacteriota bacterium]